MWVVWGGEEKLVRVGVDPIYSGVRAHLTAPTRTTKQQPKQKSNMAMRWHNSPARLALHLDQQAPLLVVAPFQKKQMLVLPQRRRETHETQCV
jgi:hypothetical protein